MDEALYASIILLLLRVPSGFQHAARRFTAKQDFRLGSGTCGDKKRDRRVCASLVLWIYTTWRKTGGLFLGAFVVFLIFVISVFFAVFFFIVARSVVLGWR